MVKRLLELERALARCSVLELAMLLSFVKTRNGHFKLSLISRQPTVGAYFPNVRFLSPHRFTMSQAGRADRTLTLMQGSAEDKRTQRELNRKLFNTRAFVITPQKRRSRIV